jgi:SAM-dependent methyltransferase
MLQQEAAWFESWFDSPFYHILYSHRDTQEAESFLSLLNQRLHLAPHSKLLDLACGKGRHSIFLNQLGYHVTGIDLSAQNIDYCKEFESDTLEFHVHDMRRILCVNYFDAIFNLFTSFGYFEQNHQNELVIEAAVKGLVPGGYFIIDYLNAAKAKSNLSKLHEIEIEGINFAIEKNIFEDWIVKDIKFKHLEVEYNFQEKVKLYSAEELQNMLVKSGLSILTIYGDYKLNKFDIETSSRLIIIARKL